MKQLEYAAKGRFAKNKITNKVEKQIWVNFYNLDPADASELKTRFKAMESKKGGPGNVSMVTNNPTVQNNPKNIKLKAAFDYLAQTGKYEMPSWDLFLYELEGADKDIITTQDAKDIDKSTDELWAQFMREIKDPKTQELLKSMGQYTLSQSAYGWKISARNLIRVRAQKPDATFVQTRNQWKNKYGRKVIPTATRIGIQVPLSSANSDAAAKRSHMKSLGWGDNVSMADLTQQQKDQVDIGSRGRDASYFTTIAYYDVSDTELINPNGPDKWAEEAGFDNNLTGHLNPTALSDIARSRNISQDEANELYHNENGDVKALAKALAVSIDASDLGVSTALPSTDNENAYRDCLIRMVAWCADKLIEKNCKIVKSENRKQGCAVATTIVLCLCKVCADKVAYGLNNGDLTEQSYYELKNVINRIISMINAGMPKNESITLYEMEIPMLDSVDQLLSMMGMTVDDVRKDDMQIESKKQKKVLKEEFDSMLNRMREADERKWK